MDELTQYVFSNYGHLMTIREIAADRTITVRQKAGDSALPKLREMLTRKWVSNDPEVLQLLEGGSEQFYVNVRERILREHSAEAFLNRCPQCGGLARTPRAKQCRHCFFSWHEPE